MARLTFQQEFQILRCFPRRDVDLYLASGDRRDRASHSARYRGPDRLHDPGQTGAAVRIHSR